MEQTTQIMEQIVETTEQAMQYEFAFTPEKFIDALPIMGTGMLGIFIVMGIIILCVGGLNRIGTGKKKKPSDSANK